MKKVLLLALAVIALIVAMPARAQVVDLRASNPNSSPAPVCNRLPTYGVGRTASMCYAKITWYYGAQTYATACATNAQNTGFNNGTTTVGDPDPNYNFRVMMAYVIPSPSATNWNAGVCDYDRTTGNFIAGGPLDGGAQLCNNVGSAYAHSEPAMMDLGYGFVAIEVCGNQNGWTAGTAPYNVGNIWGDASGRGTGSTFVGLPFVIGNCVGATDCTGVPNACDMLTGGCIKWIPASGFSEGSAATYGGVTVLCGQNQGAYTAGTTAGMQACVTIRAVDSAGHYTIDTACTVGGANVAFNFTTTNLQNNACGATWSLSQNVHGNVMALIDIAGETGGSASITLPAVGTGWTSHVCSYTLTGNASTDATAISNGIVNGTLTGCSGSGTYYTSFVFSNCGTWSPCTTGQTLTIEPVNANPPTMATAAFSGCTGCTATPGPFKDVRANNAGVYTHFSYGTAQGFKTVDGRYFLCDIIDTQNQTSYMGHGNNYALNMRNLCTRGPDLTATGATGTFGQYVFGDATMLDPNGPSDPTFPNVGPQWVTGIATGSTPAPGRIGLGPGPYTSCGNLANTPCTTYDDNSGTAHNVVGMVQPCTGVCTPPSGWTPFIYTATRARENSLAVQTADAPPIYSNYGIVGGANNNLVTAYVCPRNVTPFATEVCFVIQSHSTGQTTNVGFIENGVTNTTSWQPTLAMVRAPSGNLVVLVAAQESGIYPGCTKDPCLAVYVSTDNGLTWTRTNTFVPAWASTSPVQSTICELTPDIEGNHIRGNCWNGTGASGGTHRYAFDLYTGQM